MFLCFENAIKMVVVKIGLAFLTQENLKSHQTSRDTKYLSPKYPAENSLIEVQCFPAISVQRNILGNIGCDIDECC